MSKSQPTPNFSLIYRSETKLISKPEGRVYTNNATPPACPKQQQNTSLSCHDYVTLKIKYGFLWFARDVARRLFEVQGRFFPIVTYSPANCNRSRIWVLHHRIHLIARLINRPLPTFYAFWRDAGRPQRTAKQHVLKCFRCSRSAR